MTNHNNDSALLRELLAHLATDDAGCVFITGGLYVKNDECERLTGAKLLAALRDRLCQKTTAAQPTRANVSGNSSVDNLGQALKAIAEQCSDPDTTDALDLLIDNELEELQAQSVTNILLRVVPGEDGMGEEVYAKSVAEVEHEFARLTEHLEAAAIQKSKIEAAVLDEAKRYFLSTDDLDPVVMKDVAAVLDRMIEQKQKW